MFTNLQSESSCRRMDTSYSTFEQSPKTEKTAGRRGELGACGSYERFSIYFGPGRMTFLHGARVSIRRMGGEHRGPSTLQVHFSHTQGSTFWHPNSEWRLLLSPTSTCHGTATLFNSGNAVEYIHITCKLTSYIMRSI